jgi:uncharacterized membrane protein YkoI
MGILDRLFGKKVKEVDLNHGLPDSKKTPEIPTVKKPRTKKAKAENINPLADFGFSAEQIVELEKTAKEVKTATKKKTKKEKAAEPELTPLEKEKAEATAKKEPWVSVVSIELDMDNMTDGAFELDWNDYFVVRLMKAGYKGTDVEVVNQWFEDTCRNVIQQNYEQHLADPINRAEALHHSKNQKGE